MPTVLPVTELQRNTAALTDEAMRTKEPIYLTRRGKAAVVLLDAAEYDREMSYRKAIIEREKRVCEGIARGHDEIGRGESSSLDDMLSQLADKWSL